MPGQRRLPVLGRSKHGKRSRALHSEDRDRLFFPLDNEHVTHSANAGGVFRHPAALAHWKTFESGGADVPINARGAAADREAVVGGVPF